ncbi:MAG: Gfo/Idh/MocA family oxidoreductase [bacterium]
MFRRRFLRSCVTATGLSLAGGPLLASNTQAKSGPNDRITVAVAGVRGRGNRLLRAFASLPDVDVKYVCDVDSNVLHERTEEVTEQTGKRPEAIKDFRQALDDNAVDVLVLGTPDHWHAIPTIMACQANKDVYVEKPDGHNLLEGQTMVAAARKYGRIVQLGTQCRSSKHIISAIEYIREGNLGQARFAKAWESVKQGIIGHPPDSEPPKGVDYDTWLGPAPKRPFNIRRFHGNWRWFFDYGTGDLGNDGVHRLDYARWAFETAIAAQGGAPLGWPSRVSALGGKYYFDDDQQWPDTLQVTYDYDDGYLLTYELRIWAPYPYQGDSEGAVVYGDNGYVVIANRRWRAFDSKGEQVTEERGEVDTLSHIRNFLDCVRSREKPAADLETVGHPSSVLCHTGNISWRVGRTLRFDPKTYTFLGDEEANQYLTRQKYREPWILPRIADL